MPHTRFKTNIRLKVISRIVPHTRFINLLGRRAGLSPILSRKTLARQETKKQWKNSKKIFFLQLKSVTKLQIININTVLKDIYQVSSQNISNILRNRILQFFGREITLINTYNGYSSLQEDATRLLYPGPQERNIYVFKSTFSFHFLCFFIRQIIFPMHQISIHFQYGKS